MLRKLAQAIKPGGWLFVEDPDFLIYGIDPSVPTPMREAAEKVDKAMLQAIDIIGIDTNFGGRLSASSVHWDSRQCRAEARYPFTVEEPRSVRR